IRSNELIQARYFCSQSSPLFSPQATPALRAWGVSVSAQALVTSQTAVDDWSTEPGSPRRPLVESSLPAGSFQPVLPSVVCHFHRPHRPDRAGLALLESPHRRLTGIVRIWLRWPR